MFTSYRSPRSHFFTRMFLLKVVHPSKINQHTTFYGPTFTGAFCIRLKSLKVSYFGLVEATGVSA